MSFKEEEFLTEETNEGATATLEAPAAEAPLDLASLDPALRFKLTKLEDEFRELRGLAVRIPTLVASDSLSPDLREEVDGYNRDRGDALAQFRQITDPVLSVFARLSDPRIESPAMGVIFSAVESVRMGRLDALENAVKVAQTCQALAPRCGEELGKVAKELQADHNVVMEEVRKWLEAGGQGLESTLAGRCGTNGAAAERQFDSLAKDNLRSRKSLALSEDARNAANQANSSGYLCQKCIDDLQKTILDLVGQEMGI